MHYAYQACLDFPKFFQSIYVVSSLHQTEFDGILFCLINDSIQFFPTCTNRFGTIVVKFPMITFPEIITFSIARRFKFDCSYFSTWYFLTQLVHSDLPCLFNYVVRMNPIFTYKYQYKNTRMKVLLFTSLYHERYRQLIFDVGR